ncbi:unnamed protein product [Adineta ricciae]|uniref:Tectonic domain-containing protein n=1 Tax=Adineta ricciae TaxID=249248 RepID=A0A814W4Q3_ADIRI|nr:unnamed protein product [Adineta ricciae]
MTRSTYIPIYFILTLQLYSNIVFGQRDFANPAVTDPASCACDLRADSCDANCCCDQDCSDADISASPLCPSGRTTSSDSLAQQNLNLQKWNCSNSTTAATFDYFPFVCVQFSLSEVIGTFYSTSDVKFVQSADDTTDLRSSFVNQYPELFQASTLTASAVTGSYTTNAPVQLASGTTFTLPGSLLGFTCQQGVPVLFGVNRDVSCASNLTFCNSISTQNILAGAGTSNTTVTINFYTKTYTASTITTPNPTQEYYFQNSYTQSINDIPYTNDTIYDYCPGRYPASRTQRYLYVCTSFSNLCPNLTYQSWTGCPLRDTFQYTAINDSFFTARNSSTDGSISFSDYTSVSSLTCWTNIRQIYYQFSYSSTTNTISAVNAYVLFDSQSTTSRIVIEWNDIGSNTISSTSIPRGYLKNEALQFQRNGATSDVSALIPSASGLCVDATRQTLRYKESTTSYCSIQLARSTIQQGCHNLKLNLYIYLNVFFAPASHVLAYPNSSETPIQIRDTNQDSLDLDIIDVTRPNNRLTVGEIAQTSLLDSAYTIYDTTSNLPICFNVPSGIYIEFGYVRINISSTLSYERIVSVQYNYRYSNWQFDCMSANCDSTSTQQYIISFQSRFVDYTSRLSDTTKADIEAADDYIEDLLWLLTSGYQGEPGFRNYTIAMVLIFIGICVIVMHVLLFGIMLPF